MSTVASHPPASPVNSALSPALLDSERYIDDHIRRTRRALKVVDFASGVITLALGLLAFLLVAGLIDHWVVPGGLGVAGRTTLFGLLLLGVGWLAWRQFVPLLRTINPVYAAHTIEQTAPSLKNSLLNVLLFRHHRQAMSAKVFYALEQQAAQRLHAAPADATIDHAALLRLGYALVAVLAACAIYAVLSPKNLATSAVRIIAPWANIAAPSRVQIVNIQPGEASVAIGERVSISAEVTGAMDDEPVRLRYSTEDEQLVDETITMTRPTGAARFAADLPRTRDASAPGVQQNLEYWIEAGDARSRRFKLSVYTKPTIVVQRVRYEPPAYTGEPSRTVDNVGDIRGLEGTTVVVEAYASQAIKSAYVDFDADGKSDLRMTADGKRATASLVLQLRPDRRTPWHLNYALRFTNADGRTNEDPAQYRLDVTPDYPPEIRITQPEAAELAVRVDDIVVIAVEARDPDFAVDSVQLMGRVHDADVPLVELLAERENNHVGLYKRQTPFVPADAKLKPGDVLEYRAVAHDNRRPESNQASSEHRRLRIVGPNDPANPPQNPRGQGGNSPQKGGGAGGANNPQAGGGQGGEGNQESGESASADGQPGEGEQAAGANGKQGREGKTQEGQGVGQTAESGNSTEQGGESGGAGTPQASGGNDAAQTGEQQSGTGAGGEDQNPTQGQQQNQSPSDSGSSGGEAGAQGAAGQGAAGEQQQKVSAAGDQDSEAFQRMQEVLAEQDAANGTAGNPGGASQDGANQNPAGENASGGNPAGENRGGRPAGRDPADPSAAGANESAGADSDAGRENPTGANQSNPNGNPPPNGTPAAPAGANARANQGAGGAGSGESEASPESDFREQTDKPDGEGNPKTNDATPPGGARGNKESRSQGSQGGDRTGGGNTGAGQPAESEGAGDSGSHTAAETGAGAAGETGDGETGTDGGDAQTAQGQTGNSSRNQRGNGSEQGAANGDQPASEGGGDQQARQPGEAASAAGQPGAQSGNPSGNSSDPAATPAGSSAQQQPSGQQPGGAPSGGAQGQSSDASSGAQQASDSSKGASSGGESDAAADSASNPSSENPSGQNPPGGSASATPNGGGTGSSSVNGAGEQREPGGDAANLEYARKQTDLVLERLDDQLAKKKVDPELLRRLGWTEAELQQFVQRWKGLKAAAEAPGATTDAQLEFEKAIRAIGARPGGPAKFRATTPADKLRDLNDSYRARAPQEYADRVRAYIKGAASDEK